MTTLQLWKNRLHFPPLWRKTIASLVAILLSALIISQHIVNTTVEVIAAGLCRCLCLVMPWWASSRIIFLAHINNCPFSEAHLAITLYFLLLQVMHVKGHFMQPVIRDHYGNQPVFMALCNPLVTPDGKETVSPNSTMIFQSIHGLDMKYLELASK